MRIFWEVSDSLRYEERCQVEIKNIYSLSVVSKMPNTMGTVRRIVKPLFAVQNEAVTVFDYDLVVFVLAHPLRQWKLLISFYND